MDFQKMAQNVSDAYFSDLKKLIAFPSVDDKNQAAPGAPFGPAVADALAFFLRLAESFGFAVHNWDGYAGTALLGQGEECVGVLGHLDVVPAGEGWSGDPFEMREKDGYVFGRGVLDDKGPILAALFAMRLVKEAGIPLRRQVLLIAGCSEETGMEDMEYYRKHGPIPDLGFTPDAEFPVIYGEKGNIFLTLDSDDSTCIRSFEAGTAPNIVIGQARALVDCDCVDETLFDFYLKTNDLQGSIDKTPQGVLLTVKGVPAHGSMPYNGINAGVHLLNFIASACHDPLARDLHTLLKDWKGSPEGINMQGLAMGFLTMNPGIIHVENGHAHVLVDIRYPNDTTPQAVLEGFEKACAKLDSRITPAIEHAGKPLFVDPGSKLVRDLMSAYQKYSGDTFHPAFTIGGGTYAKEFDHFVAFGPEKSWEKAPEGLLVGGCHQADEGIAKKDLIEAMAIYAEAIVRLAS